MDLIIIHKKVSIPTRCPFEVTKLQKVQAMKVKIMPESENTVIRRQEKRRNLEGDIIREDNI